MSLMCCIVVRYGVVYGALHLLVEVEQIGSGRGIAI